MSETALERKLDRVLKFMTEQRTIERWKTEAVFMQCTGKTTGECEAFRRAHPELIRWETFGAFDAKGREIRRNPLYDYNGFIALHKPIKNTSPS